MLSLKSERIPRATIRRLAVYVQVLESMQRNGVEVISSGPLAEACDVNASQVRKDLAYFGEFGVRGVGYNVASLIAAIKASLGVDREWRAALIGVGNLGRALLHHAEFKARGFNIVGAFDCDPFKIGEQVYGLEVTCTSDLKSAVDAKGIEIGIITTPPQLYPFVWACGPVDVERMDEGSRYLLGKRDFASLKNAGTDLRTTVRTILSITRTPEGPLPEGCLELTWRFEADGFLKQMVRNTMGLLVAVGRGKLEPADIPGILDACDRRIAPLTAPACGLTMKKVWYDDMFPLAASGHEGA